MQDLVTLEDGNDALVVGFEGELLHLKLFNLHTYTNNQPLKVTYGSAGAQLLRVIRQDNLHLYLYVPLRNTRILSDRRSFPRLQLPGTAHIELPAVSGPVHVFNSNLSLKGVAFTSETKLEPGTEFLFHYLDHEFVFQAAMQVVYATEDPDGWRCGASYVNLDPEVLQTLRAYVLKLQLSAINH